MRDVRSKYNHLGSTAPEYSNDDIEYIDNMYKQINKLPQEIIQDINQGLSHVCNKRGLDYVSVMNLPKYQIGLLAHDNYLKIHKAEQTQKADKQ